METDGGSAKEREERERGDREVGKGKIERGKRRRERWKQVDRERKRERGERRRYIKMDRNLIDGGHAKEIEKERGREGERVERDGGEKKKGRERDR